MAKVHIVNGNFGITDPNWPKFEIKEVYTSDAFTDSGPLDGRKSDTFAGGLPVTWTDASGRWKTADGVLTAMDAQASERVFTSDMPADATLEFTLSQMPGTEYDQIFYAYLRFIGDADAYVGMNIRGSGEMTLLDKKPGESLQASWSEGPRAKQGDLITLTARGDSLELYINGVLNHTSSVAHMPAGAAAFSLYPGSSNPAIDNLIIAEA